MRYLENAFKFTLNNFLLAIPLLISMAIPSLIIKIGTAGFTAKLAQKYTEIFMSVLRGEYLDISANFFDELISMPMIICVTIGGFLLLLFSILIYPATYGLINKKYETGNATLSDFTQCMSKYIGRYIQFGLLSIAISIGLVLVLVILVVIASVIAALVSTIAGILLMLLFYFAFIVGNIALGIYMILWFPAVCVEDSGIIEGLKNSFKTVNGSFWPILGITILISLGGGIAGSILGIFPFVGVVISSVISRLANFVLIVYYFEIYRAKTGRFYSADNFQQINNPIE
ncbi:hypothetical protein EHE19_009170 [Ruminiclostridium herbifermentans]|uniref:DUF7847 domain-containing protein n=1 Tax=Ruminiclostridium herbifermentans TaxID=2488810 RepID=A0A4V6EP54_9FIRM|nr:hypothetical protein [Ruminiclostridium herbifermentans]QNU68546.1 hypothetical protein EHE19_009170 [Ruminiclostridium herbifermentans]